MFQEKNFLLSKKFFSTTMMLDISASMVHISGAMYAASTGKQAIQGCSCQLLQAVCEV